MREYEIIKIWNYCSFIAILLIFLDKKQALYFIKNISKSVTSSVFSLIVIVLFIYIISPLTIPFTIMNYFEKD